MSNSRGGFTLVEVVMAIVILTFGVLVLASSASGINRMLGSGQGKTRASAIASSRVETLRTVAASTTPACGSGALSSGSAVQPAGFSESWTVSGTGSNRQVKVIVQYRNGTRPQADTLFAMLLC